jgi:branched-chain amino acid transport system substrate-binding protein
MITRRFLLQSSAASAAYLTSGVWPARATNAPGVTDTEIKIGQTMPYSGPAPPMASSAARKPPTSR